MNYIAICQSTDLPPLIFSIVCFFLGVAVGYLVNDLHEILNEKKKS